MCPPPKTTIHFISDTLSVFKIGGYCFSKGAKIALDVMLKLNMRSSIIPKDTTTLPSFCFLLNHRIISPTSKIIEQSESGRKVAPIIFLSRNIFDPLHLIVNSLIEKNEIYKILLILSIKEGLS